jgi:Tol biopolymer transport system component
MFARLSGDELDVVFEASDTSGEPQVWHASRAARTDPFGAATLVVPADGGGFDPALSRDGLTLVFGSNRSRKPGGRDIFIATRPTRTDDFGAPVPVKAINGSSDEAGPYLEPGNAKIWFFVIAGTEAIWVAPESGDTFGQPAPVSELNDQGPAGFPVLSEDATYIYFRSTHDDAGLAHIWMARRNSSGGRFGMARPVTELNSLADDTPTWLSPDGCRLYLTSKRSGTYQIYLAERSP